ncbi:MAG: hypothetical protein K0U93_16435 [Gammaproteobacteria bacterium]|nr:hypothetical protein [Gammaproteobacteria bacterium]
MLRLEQLVDVDQYPIDQLDEAPGRTLVAQCREQLDRTAMCHLPGFVRSDAVRRVLDEVAQLRDRTYWMESERRAYSWRNPDDYPDANVVGRHNPNRIGSITKNEFPEEGAFVSIFAQEALTEFVRQCMGFDSLHPVACPYLSANIKVMTEGCRHAWHFDQNDGAVTLMFQPASEGGQFEYVPFLRDEGDENYARVEQLMDGDTADVLGSDLGAGSFCLFKGRRSIHRVSEVERGDRLLAVFSYHHVPGHRYKESTVRSVLGRLPDDYAASL